MRPFIQFSSRNIQKSQEYYLAFHVDNDIFAANFPKIAGFSKEYTFVPHNGNVSFISGTACVNNEPIVVIDLKRKIGMASGQENHSGKLIIVETELYDTKLKFAISYDLLGDAFEISEKRMMPTPNIGKHFDFGYVKGVHVMDRNCILILDVEKLLNIDDLIDIMLEYKKNNSSSCIDN